MSIVFWLVPFLGASQSCIYQLEGQVVDQATQQPLAFVTVFVQESGKGTVTDEEGHFHLKQLCKGEYHLTFSHIGCEAKQLFFQLHKDTSVTVTMAHSSNELEGVVIEDKSNITLQSEALLSQQQITDNSHESLSNMMESITGVSTLKNGSGLSKPVLHGMYGNRLPILNNGIAQSGQQWGNDHSPEIDPLVANSIRVVKGVGALEYAGSNLGGLILVEPGRIKREPHLHGKAAYFFESNGRGHGTNLQLQQYKSNWGWKINATLKKSGDKHAPDYFLTNTGSQEANISLQLERKFSDQWTTNLYLSSFNTEIGVLRGSHIGNLTDLETAFWRDEPFFTEDNFSYSIDAPKQRVYHQLLKLHTRYFKTTDSWFDFTLAGQYNLRKEFDVRRGGRTDKAALSLSQFTGFAEAKYTWLITSDLKLSTGARFEGVDNTNDPETGIRPLIPDYRNFESGGFLRLSQSLEKWTFEWGARYDFVQQNAATLSRDFYQDVIRYNKQFHNVSSMAALRYQLSKSTSLSYNLGYATRNPAINELYSFGLHQGVSGIEIGNVDLETEQSLKTTLALESNIQQKVFFEVLGYYQQIENYIFLEPQDEIELTIRGAFPVFEYKQTRARLIGLDFSNQIEWTSSWSTQLMYSFLQGDDLTHDIPLVYMPANNARANLNYEFKKPISIGSKKLENLSLGLRNSYVFEQNHLNEDQDFVAPPEAYYLMGVDLSTEIQLNKTRLRFTCKVDNLWNESYRDYLNRQRYFADDLGTNVILGFHLKF